MSEEPTIKQMLASIGIEVRPAKGMHRELVRTATGENIGLFTASEALTYYHQNKGAATMDKRTREALEASIKHWQENVAAEEYLRASLRAEDCALCIKFNSHATDENSEGEKTDCIGCPVMERTGIRYCEGSPYGRASRALANWRLHAENREAFRAAAQRELDFLISLRPAEEADASGCYAAFNAIAPVGDIEELAQAALDEAFPEGAPTDV